MPTSLQKLFFKLCKLGIHRVPFCFFIPTRELIRAEKVLYKTMGLLTPPEFRLGGDILEGPDVVVGFRICDFGLIRRDMPRNEAYKASVRVSRRAL